MTTITFCPMLDYPQHGWGDPINGEYCGEIAPHLAGVLTLVVHRWGGALWCVSEIETGQRLVPRYWDKDLAIRHASDICARQTVGMVERRLMTRPDWVREA